MESSSTSLNCLSPPLREGVGVGFTVSRLAGEMIPQVLPKSLEWKTLPLVSMEELGSRTSNVGAEHAYINCPVADTAIDVQSTPIGAPLTCVQNSPASFETNMPPLPP